MSGGIEASVIPRKYVKVQSNQPTSAIQGDLWFDTDTNVLYSYDGSDWNTITQDLGYIDAQQIIQNIDILTALAHSSASPSDYDTLYCDVFSDSSGYSNTIDTGNTDATFDTNLYKAVGTDGNVDTEDATNHTYSRGTQTAKEGAMIQTKTACKLIQVKIASDNTATKCYLYNSDMSQLLDTQNLSGGIATFSYDLANGTTYCVCVDREGATYTRDSFDSTYQEKDRVNIKYIGRVEGTPTANMNAREIISITTRIVGTASGATKYIQTNTITLNDNIIGYQLYSKIAINGSSSAVSYQISFDNGSTWTTAKDLNTKHANSTTGTSIKIKIKLIADTGSSSHAKSSNYGLLVWY